jgi:hypothetical protein
MTEWYCHFDPAEFAQAWRVQENLLQPEDTKPAGDTAGAVETLKKTTGEEKVGTGKERDKAGRVLSFPAQEKNRKQKWA